MVTKKKGRKIRKLNYRKDYTDITDPIDYIESRGFILYVNSDAGLVYRYAMDDRISLYLNMSFNMVQMIYNDDFNDPVYSGIPTAEDFHIVLNQFLFDK